MSTPRIVRAAIYLYNSSSSELRFIQGDTTLLILKLFENHNKSFVPTDVVVNAERADKSFVVQNKNISIQKNTLNIILDPEMVDVAGKIKLELKFPDDGGIISSHIINGTVAPDLINNQTSVPASELKDALILSVRSPYVDINTNTWWTFDIDLKMFVDTGVTAGDAVVDSVFDINSNRAIANKTVTAKFIETDYDIAALQSQTDENSAEIGDLQNGLTNVEDKANQLRTDTDTNTTFISELTTNIQNINDKIDIVESDTANIHGEIDTLGNRIDSSDNLISSLRDDIDGVNEKVSEIESAIADNIDDINNKISGINDNIDNIDNDIVELRTDTDNNTAAITDLADRTTQNTADIADMSGITDGKINTAKSEIYRNTSSPLITKTIPAPAVTIQPNEEDMALRELVIRGNTTQAGTPTPDVPVPIVGVVNPVVMFSGKNLFDTDRYYKFLVDNDTTPVSPTTRGNDGQYDYISMNGSGINGLKYMENEFIPNTQYTMSFKAKHQGNPGIMTVGFKFVYTDGAATYIDVPISALDWTKFVQTSLPNKTISHLQLSYNTFGYVDFTELMLVKGVYNADNIPNYLPYSGQSVTLNDITLHGTGDVRDTIEVKDGRVLWTQRCNIMRFGIEIPTYSISQYGTGFYFEPSPAKILQVNGEGLCTHLPRVTNFGTRGAIFGTGGAEHLIYCVNITDTTGTTIEEKRAWVQEQYDNGTPFTVVYTLRTPIVTDITNTPNGQALLAACEIGGTTIAVSSGATVEVVYNRDMSVAFAEVLAALSAMMGG